LKKKANNFKLLFVIITNPCTFDISNQTGKMDIKINNLKHGESITISFANGITCSVERSKNKLRFVRTFANGSFEIFKTISI